MGLTLGATLLEGSRCQFRVWAPHAKSVEVRIVDPRAFRWSDANWRGLSLDDYIIYEIHAGTFTSEGSFDAIVPHLEDIRRVGVTAVELMPVAQFPGHRNWGYDGVYLFAVQNSYGGPEGLTKLVNACHDHDLAVGYDVTNPTHLNSEIGREQELEADSAPVLPKNVPSEWVNVVTGERLQSRASDHGHVLQLGEVFARFPVAVLRSL
jgi:maltooligosyltrehalose trehalohydrolase